MASGRQQALPVIPRKVQFFPEFKVEQEADLAGDDAVVPVARVAVFHSMAHCKGRGDVNITRLHWLHMHLLLPRAGCCILHVQATLTTYGQCQVEDAVRCVGVPAHVSCWNGVTAVVLHCKVTEQPKHCIGCLRCACVMCARGVSLMCYHVAGMSLCCHVLRILS